ncbi:methylmalonyl Co-A mutase-associated GTPase MeaB [Polycladidibacter hongkongensis]|uniref:methylmalonyl Co-A mutase-associated GTPase MeaB n=1 Tax=Polycladidibacter hongkongensis TaxID=1647556 RepID=UPI000834D7BB|nr:methylmalonyl Co-A mutase-associated GTPase MeaB [Pseudovibrio hongkongensis]
MAITPTQLDRVSAQLTDDLLTGKRAALARAITLVESKRADHRRQAEALLSQLMPHTGKAFRVGITGVPGVGKSTTIDNLGSMLTKAGHKVAVLAVDPSSTRSGGAILGDKTRMAKLAYDDNAYIRPSPSAGTLGGVASKTRETMLLCEAVGFDVILVETVGIGQSETTVAQMVDCFLVMMLPGAGDELQGIKKGVLEVADLIAVNKADGEGAARARSAASAYKAALSMMAPRSQRWRVPVTTMSGLTGEDLDRLWRLALDYKAAMQESGAFARRRQNQQVDWMWEMIEAHLRNSFQEAEAVSQELPQIMQAVRSGTLPATAAVSKLLAAFHGN